jgi:hypothetical protein
MPRQGDLRRSTLRGRPLRGPSTRQTSCTARSRANTPFISQKENRPADHCDCHSGVLPRPLSPNGSISTRLTAGTGTRHTLRTQPPKARQSRRTRKWNRGFGSLSRILLAGIARLLNPRFRLLAETKPCALENEKSTGRARRSIHGRCRAAGFSGA